MFVKCLDEHGSDPIDSVGLLELSALVNYEIKVRLEFVLEANQAGRLSVCFIKKVKLPRRGTVRRKTESEESVWTMRYAAFSVQIRARSASGSMPRDSGCFDPIP